MMNLWGKIDADVTTPGWTAPLTLAGAFARATAVTDVALIRTHYQTVTDAETDLSHGIKKRDVFFKKSILPRLKQYGSAVVSKFPADHALVLSLPALTPPAGSTPNPVAASGLWNPATLMGEIVWTPSADPNLDHFVILTSPGPTWSSADQTVVASMPADTTSYSTNVGLVAAGAFALFKVVVVLTTGNEKASAVVKITRPG